MSPWWWVVAGGLVVVLLALDLMIFHRHARTESTREAVTWSIVWVGVGLLFSLVVGFIYGKEGALQYLTAFLIEKSLSIDNLFVFIAVFNYFGVERRYQHRVLFWGILGAILTRGAFILGGVALITTFHWVLYLLGGLLIVTGVRLALVGDEVHPERNVIVRWASRMLPIDRDYRGERFVILTPTGRKLTPLILVLIAIESADVMFAVDSVPAVLAVSQKTFIVYTSNIFAILGLRALYFVLAGALASLRFLKPALALVLVLIGAKMLLTDYVEVPTIYSLVAVAVIVGVATAASLLFPGGPEAQESSIFPVSTDKVVDAPPAPPTTGAEKDAAETADEDQPSASSS